MNKQDLINYGKDLGLKQSDIEKIIQKEADLTISQLFLLEEIDDKYIENIKSSFDRLKKGEPLEYILNKAEFYGLDFYVDNRVLIPRNDTEVMVKEVINELNNTPISTPFPLQEKGNSYMTLIDVGTGSGAIPISVLKNTDKINKCYAIELSQEALEVAKINVEIHGLENKIELINGDLLTPFLSPTTYNLLSTIIITANLPYIRTGDYKSMDDSVVFYEPDLALYGGEKTGFELYEKLIEQCLELKEKLYSPTARGELEGGLTLFIEIGYDQYEYSKNYLKNLGLNFEYFKDNSGIYRCVKIEF
ncbi:MAG: peptide chain release factor N(5)-glutamine methyltransferase [Candidatus Gracilibacteria bacterium]|nr:peptide chain release factor N(5)-glutamine methyltransferase [Candidatus Gracilibacteria bacterium]